MCSLEKLAISLELKIDERLQVGGNKLIQQEDSNEDDDRHYPQREEGEVHPIPAFPAFREPVDYHADGKKDKDNSIFIKHFSDNAVAPFAANAGDHAFSGIPGSAVCFRGIKVGPGAEKESCKSDEDKSEQDRPGPVDPFKGMGGKNPGIDIVDKGSEEDDSHPDGANDESGIWKIIFKSDKGSEAAEGKDGSAKFLKIAPHFEDENTHTVQSAPNHKIPAGSVPQTTQQHGNHEV